MYLKSAQIRHYKSLDNVHIEFSNPITVLVGPNAVGKSNVVDCLRFVRDAVAIDLEHAVSKRGGIARVRQYSKTKPFKLSVHLDLIGHGDPDSEQEFYEFSIQSETGSNFAVDSEKCAYVEAKVAPGDMRGLLNSNLEMKPQSFSRDRNGTVSNSFNPAHHRVAQDQLTLGQVGGLLYQLGWPIQRFIDEWRFSVVYPNMLRDPATPDSDKVLAEDGKNWASVIKALRRTARGRGALDRINEAMRAVIPTFIEVTVSTVGSYLVPRFWFSLGKRETVAFDPVQLSDGTLRIFGILLALYQIPAPRMLVIEEPEQSVQPGVLGVLADALRECSETTQIIVTTHSPHFIDYFKPEEVRVVTLDNGATKVSAVKRTQLEAVKKRLMSMQEFMLAEGLQPEEA